MYKKWQGFYSISQVSRLASIPHGTLAQWKLQKVIYPSIRIIDSNGHTVEGYSYADLAIIKLLRALRIRQINLRSAAKALRHLYDRFGAPSGEGWSQAHVYVIDKEVFAQKPDDWDTTLATKHGQRAEMRVLGELFEEEAALLIPKHYSDYVEINPDVMEGQPIIKDTRVPTFILATLFNEGMSVTKIADYYKPIPVGAIERAIEYEKKLDEAAESTVTRARASVN